MRFQLSNTKRYRIKIGLKTVVLTFKRRIIIILSIFIPIALVLILFTCFGITKTYKSTVVLSRNDTIGSLQYQIIESCISNPSENELNPGPAYTTAENLKKQNIFHSNGETISADEIKKGLSFYPFKGVTYSFTFDFASYDKTIVQSVSDELAAVSVDMLKSISPDFTQLYYVPATTPIKNSNEVRFLAFGLATTIVLTFGIAFLYEIFSDKVYDAKDLQALGVEAFELNVLSTESDKEK